jgi:hypothetical protein
MDIFNMGLLSKLIGLKKTSRPDDNPPLYGGDGMSEHSPVIVNCASITMAQHLIDKFINEKCGVDWRRGDEFTLESPNKPGKLVKAISISKSNGSEARYYFDLSRPLNNAVKMLGL